MESRQNSPCQRSLKAEQDSILEDCGAHTVTSVKSGGKKVASVTAS